VADPDLFIEANGLTFACLSQGEGPLVLCLHGYPDTAHTWDDLLPALAKAGYRAVAPWMRGYPPTSIPSDGDCLGLSLAEDASALITALGYESAIVIGHDWGALAAYATANLVPEKVDKLVTIAIPHPGGLVPGPRTLWGLRHFFFYSLPWLPERHLRKNGWAGVRAICARWSPNWVIPDDEFGHVVESLEAPGGLAGALRYYRSFMRRALWPRGLRTAALLQKKTSMPALALAGGFDPALYVRDYETARRAYTGPYEVVVIDDTGHFLHREKPEEANAAILGFLAG
jgi:pimeloyl-ACP methyl ester carboxylesterase